MTKYEIMTILAICSCFIGMLGTIIGSFALIKVLAIEKSTHSVHFVPAEMQPEKDWATSDKDINDINNEVKEENEFYGI